MINKLKKNPITEISSLADKIVAKWKEAVDANKKRKRGDEEGEGKKKLKVEDGLKKEKDGKGELGFCFGQSPTHR